MIKRLIVKGVMLGVVIFGFAIYYNYLSTGQMPEWLNDPWGKLTRSVSNAMDSVEHEVQGAVKDLQAVEYEGVERLESGIYRWVDETGHVHFGDNPPEDAKELQAVDIDPDVNVVQSATLVQPIDQPSPKPELEQLPIPTLHDSEGIKAILDEAKRVRDMANDRLKDEKEALEKL